MQTIKNLQYCWVPTTPACMWENRPEEYLSSDKLESTHPSRTVVKSIDFFMESSESCATMLTHYSEPLTTGPDYNTLLRLLALAGDVHPNPGPPEYPCSVCFKNVTGQGTSHLCTRYSHRVHSRCSGLRNVADYHRANGWICTACRTPPQPRAPSPPPSTAHTPSMSDKTFNILQWNANGIGNKRDGTMHLHPGAQRQSVGHSGVQAHSKIEKSQHLELHPSTTGLPLGPGGGLLFLSITQSALLSTLVVQIRKPGKDSSQVTSYRPISLLCPAAKVLETLVLASWSDYGSIIILPQALHLCVR